MAEQTDRQYFVYLDLLRESGRTNMLAAAPFLEGASRRHLRWYTGGPESRYQLKKEREPHAKAEE